MENNNNQKNNDSNMPPMPSLSDLAASWSVWLGIFGLVGNCLCGPIWLLPSGLFLGIGGIVCAVLSKKGKPFTEQARLGLTLSIIAAVCGLLMALATIFVLDIMASDTPMGAYARQLWEQFEVQMENILGSMPAAK